MLYDVQRAFQTNLLSLKWRWLSSCFRLDLSSCSSRSTKDLGAVFMMLIGGHQSSEVFFVTLRMQKALAKFESFQQPVSVSIWIWVMHSRIPFQNTTVVVSSMYWIEHKLAPTITWNKHWDTANGKRNVFKVVSCCQPIHWLALGVSVCCDHHYWNELPLSSCRNTQYLIKAVCLLQREGHPRRHSGSWTGFKKRQSGHFGARK